MNIRPVQRQGNGVDCGLFAIVFSVTQAFGNKPEVITYNEGNLRCYLFGCFKLKKLSPFLEYENNRRVKRARAVTSNQNVYSISRRTCFKEGTDDSTDNFTAPCCVCYEWYRKKCMKIPMNIFRTDNIAKLWRCKS